MGLFSDILWMVVLANVAKHARSEDTVANTKGKKKKGGAKRGQNCYATPTFSGVPNAKRGEQNQKRIASPPGAGGRIRGGSQVGKVAT